MRDATMENCLDLRHVNRRLNQQEYEAGRAVLESRPRMIFVELTRACNLACPMCRPEVLAGPQYRMSDALLDRLGREVLPYVEAVDLRGSGESTLDRRLPRLVGDLTADGVRVQLFTNLTTRNAAFWRELGRCQLDIAVSVDAASPEKLEKLRHGLRVPVFLRHLAALQEGRAGARTRSELFFSAAVGDDNLDELSGLVRLAADHGVEKVRLNPLTRHRGPGHYPEIGVSADRHAELHDSLAASVALGRRLGVAVELAATLDNSDTAGFDRCLHPWAYCVVEYDGRLVYCDHFVGNEAAVVSSMNERHFMDAWNHETWQSIRRHHVEKRFDWARGRGLECDWCYTNRYADCEGEFDARFQPLRLTREED